MNLCMYMFPHTHLDMYMNTVSLKKESLWGSLVSKGTCCQTWWLEFGPQNTHARRRKLTSTKCPLPSYRLHGMPVFSPLHTLSVIEYRPRGFLELSSTAFAVLLYFQVLCSGDSWAHWRVGHHFLMTVSKGDFSYLVNWLSAKFSSGVQS